MITLAATFIKTALVRLGRAVTRAVVGEAAGDIPVDLTELVKQAEAAMRPHGPREPSQPLPYKDVERQRAMASSAAHPMARPETARPPPIPEPPLPEQPALAWAASTAAPFPATFPVTDLPQEQRKADTVRPPVRLALPRPAPRAPSRPPPPTPAMPNPAMGRAEKRLPPRPTRKP